MKNGDVKNDGEGNGLESDDDKDTVGSDKYDPDEALKSGGE